LNFFSALSEPHPRRSDDRLPPIYNFYYIKNIFPVAPALPGITSYLHSRTSPAVLYLPPDPLTGKALLQDDLRDQTQGGPGGQDRAVEPQYRRDHLQLNPRARIYPEHRICYPVHPEDQEQVQPPDQAPHAQDHEADRQYQRCGIMWGDGTNFHQREDREEADPAAF